VSAGRLAQPRSPSRDDAAAKREHSALPSRYRRMDLALDLSGGPMVGSALDGLTPLGYGAVTAQVPTL
jgi:hypothetical protein